MNTIRDELKIITKITIPDTRQLSESLAECHGFLKTLCDELLNKNPNDLCKPFRRELKWQINQVQRQGDKLKDMYGRQKRGLIDIGGKISKFVFGTMDQEDATEIYDQLKNLQDNQVKLLEVENQQIAVIKSNFETLTKPINQLQEETYEVREKLNQLITRTNDQNTFIERTQNLTHQVAELSSLILIQCMHVNRMQEEATEIVNTLNIRKTHPMIITHNKIIEIIRSQYGSSNSKMERHEILRQVVESDYTELDGQIIIKISIPIIDKEEYTLFKPYLLPFTTEEEPRVYEVNTEYIAVNEERSKTIELHTEDIRKCKKINSNMEMNFILCHHTQPILPIQNTHCLTTLFINPWNAERSCKSLPTNPPNAIIKLEISNTWLYTVSKATSLTVQCKNNTKRIQIIGEGLLTFLTSCRITTKEFTIIVPGHPKQIELEHHEVQVESSEEDSTNKIRQNNTKEVQDIQKLRLADHKTHNKNFLEETNKINQLQKTTADIELQKGHNKTTRTINATVIGISIISIILMIVVILRVRRRKTKATAEGGHEPSRPKGKSERNMRII